MVECILSLSLKCMYLVSRVHGVYVNLSILDEKGSKTYKKRKSPIGLGSIHSNGLLLD